MLKCVEKIKGAAEKMVILTVRVNKALLNEITAVQNKTLRNFTIISYCFKEVNFPNSAKI